MILALSCLVGAYVLACVALLLLQGRLVWYPGPAPTVTPASVGLAFEDLNLATRDGETLHAWLALAPSARGSIVFCHGNAGNIGDRLERTRVFVALGYDVLLFEYRGYGGSSGTPSEEGTYVDAEAAWDELVRRGRSPRTIVLYGESMGGAVAIELARRRPAAALVVEDTFTSIPDMAQRLYPWLPARWLARVRYSSIDKVGALKVPMLVLHSRADELVPFENGQALARAAKARLIETGGPHNGPGFAARPEWVEEVRAFMDERTAQ